MSYADAVRQLNLPFIKIDPSGLPLFDGVHTNRVGRELVSAILADGWLLDAKNKGTVVTPPLGSCAR